MNLLFIYVVLRIYSDKLFILKFAINIHYFNKIVNNRMWIFNDKIRFLLNLI